MNRLSFSTSTSLLVQQLVPSGTLALEADWSICADVGAAAVVYQALIQPWRVEREREREREIQSLVFQLLAQYMPESTG